MSELMKKHKSSFGAFKDRVTEGTKQTKNQTPHNNNPPKQSLHSPKNQNSMCTTMCFKQPAPMLLSGTGEKKNNPQTQD